MSRRSEKTSLIDIKEAIKRISMYSRDLDYDGFLLDIKTQDAI